MPAMTNAGRQAAAAPTIRAWLWIVALLIFAMVLVGGATRLTDSGLSITEWQPILGALPPFNEADWLAAFGKYQLTSEFKLQNSAMTLAEFKFIYWWEWGHRNLGRFIGLAFAVPFLLFTIFRRLTKPLFWRLLVLFVLGGAQGGLGWFMVKSGLSGRVDVSQYRLAAHLTLAAAIFALTIWTLLGVGQERSRPRTWHAWSAALLVGLVLLQIAAGGLVAGLDAGMGYNTWPKMDGQFVPEGLFAMEPRWRNFFENAMTVQFVHRGLAYGVLAFAIMHAWQACTLSSLALLYVLFIQAFIGVVALVTSVPLPLALAHQAGAMLALMAAVFNLHRQLRPMPGGLVGQPALIGA
jgi:heme a synthase